MNLIPNVYLYIHTDIFQADYFREDSGEDEGFVFLVFQDLIFDLQLLASSRSGRVSDLGMPVGISQILGAGTIPAMSNPPCQCHQGDFTAQ